MAIKEIKGRIEHKNMLISGAVVPPEKDGQPPFGAGALIAVMFGCLLIVATIVMATAPIWFNHS